ncbi:ABC transporter ATP-binding protein/permease [Oceanirhabdus sp. W0125-5]|uniref:ABC transporter ATP-binding protein/permease n=1 Tax=Oceanirhabdus sp. W0125-5 TaxID=2999116 RepID=UPI0022F2A87A|nr:ABC transporter ATP-binding protein/permease [Oceanirhabdus sp. W0125-5]WBW95059.1 ABC transporter ATP-binding protein/permease [Oceanirhabdus sp. W0125-5]
MINKRLLSLSESSKKWVGLTVLMNWVSIICNIFIIVFIGHMIDDLYKKKISNNLIPHLLFIFFMLLLRFTCNRLSTRFSYYSSAEVRKLLREKIYKKLLKLGVNYTDTISTSSTVQIAVDGVEALEVYFGRYLPQLFYSLLAPMTLFIVVSFISLKAAIVLILCVPLIPISIIAVMKIAKKLLSKYWNIYTNLGDSFLENLQGLTTLKIFDLDGEKNNEMNEEAETFRKITMKVLAMQLNSINIMDLIAFGGAAIGILIAINEFSLGKISVGGVIVIILLSSEFFIPLRLLGSFFHVAMNGIAASDKIFNLLDKKVENERELTGEEKKLLENINIKFNNVDFSYDKKRTVLKDINLHIENKKMVALVGESGCGKSTVTNLLLKLKKVDNGEITLNGLNLNDIPFNKLREKIGFISHNSYIFNGTIEDNMKMGKYDATNEEIKYALEKANLYDFVLDLPNKLKTNVGEGGAFLSGGQRQRLALARIIISNPEIIIFDEATSNIDVESEEKIWKSIYQIAKNKTVLVISHRLANVRNADLIYVLDNGNMVEFGSHNQLMKNKSKYYDLLINQEKLEGIMDNRLSVESEVAISGE